MIIKLKPVLFFLIISASQFSLAQNGILFSENGLKAALEKGKAENKPVMLWCYSSTCHHCKVMKETVFPNAQVADYFNKTFVCVAQDMDKGAGPELNKTIKISSFPTFIFYNSSGDMVYRVEGELKPDVFIAEGKNALNAKKQFPFLKQQFEKDISNSANCLDYIRALKKGGMDASDIASRYFATQSENQLLSEINWRVFTNGVTDFTSPMFQFVIKHQVEFAQITSKERVKRKLDFEVKNLLEPVLNTMDTLNYPAKRALAAQIHSFSADSLIFYYDLKLYDLSTNWKKYTESCLQFANKFAWNNHYQLADIANNLLSYNQDSETLKKALDMALRSSLLDEEYDTYLLCARIYKKLNDKPNALKMAEKAKNFATKAGWEGKEAIDFIKAANKK